MAEDDQHRVDRQGHWAQQAEARLSDRRWREEVERIWGYVTDGTVDVDRMRALVEAARPLDVTFHRAIDLTRDLGEALEALVHCGVSRVLTSGGKPRAADAISELAALVRQAGDRIVVMPGGGINAANAVRIIEETAAIEIHVGGTLPAASVCTPTR